MRRRHFISMFRGATTGWPLIAGALLALWIIAMAEAASPAFADERPNRIRIEYAASPVARASANALSAYRSK